MAKMRAVQVPSAKGPFQMVERDIPEPGLGWVRIRVEACGICHADSYVKEGLWPGIEYPRVPGHEVAGVIDAVGSGVAAWKPGQRVGVGWYAAVAAIAKTAGGAISFFALCHGALPRSLRMEATPITCSRPRRRSR
jgi:D-arabinose 1-dehydrogenase-like Zn-dependent alcohol dehydrogenase